MADLSPLGFNPANIEDMGDGFKVVPPDIYNVMITESEVQDTAKGGKMLVIKNQIIDGPFIGNMVTDRLNILNASETAQKIGLSQLKNICDAIGFVGALKDSSQLHGKPFSIKVSIEQYTNKEGNLRDKNRIDKRMSKAAGADLKMKSGDATPGAAGSNGQTMQKKAAGW